MLMMDFNDAAPQHEEIHYHQRPESSVLEMIQGRGILIDRVIFDGKLRRYATRDKPYTKNAYVTGWEDGRGAFIGDWSTGESGEYVGIGGARPSGPDMDRIRAVIEERRQRDAARVQNAKSKAREEYDQCANPDPAHPYLRKKGVGAAPGVRQDRSGRLVVPMLDFDNELTSLQYIPAVGKKLTMTGGVASRIYYPIHGMDTQPVYVCEGYATAMSVHEATGATVLVSFGDRNMEHVAKFARATGPTRKIIIAGDNDPKPDGSNPGRTAAIKAAQAVGGQYALPAMDGKKCDWNDLHQERGIAEVKRQLNNTVEKNKFVAKFITGASLETAFLATLQQGWTVKGVLPESGLLNMVYGPPGTYKSFIVLDMAASVSQGIEWHGRKTKKGHVLYLAAEGQAGVLKRLKAWRLQREVPELSNFTLLPAPCLVDNGAELESLIASLAALPEKPKLIIFDTLARSMTGDENSTVDMSAVVEACGRLIEATGAQVIIVHHTGKDVTRGARGSIALEGATDTMFKTAKHGDGRQLILVCERQKDDEPTPDLIFSMDVVDTGFVNLDGDPVRSLVPALDVDATAELRKKRADAACGIKGALKVAWDSFQEALRRKGCAPTAEVFNAMSGADGRVVHEDDWRAMAYEMEISKGGQDSKRKAFKRGVDDLIKLQKVSRFESFYWICAAGH